MHMTQLLTEISESAQRNGGLWVRDKILLKLMEEAGELSQAFRKKDRASQVEEFGDVLFACFCLAICEDIDPVAAVLSTIKKGDASRVVDRADQVLVNLRADRRDGKDRPVIGSMWIPLDRSLSDFQAEVTELRNVLIDDSGGSNYSDNQLIEMLETRGYELAEPPQNVVL
jgi:NTP pyrophosphatase (non-canonical NTP hydrolase)